MRLGSFLTKALFWVGLVVPVFSAEVSPLHFEGIDDSRQQEYWDYLIKFKLWGTNGISMGRAKLPDESGWTGTARGGFKGTNNQIVLGGPVIVGGDISLGSEDRFSTGPIRATGSFNAGANNGSGNFFASTSCIDGYVNDLAKAGIYNAGGSLFQGGDAQVGPCVETLVAGVKTDLKVPVLNASGYSGSVNVGDRQTGYLDVPSGEGVYDVYLESFRMGSSATLYVRIPKEGRIVRVFVRDGLNLSDHPTIQIMNVGTDASYDAGSKRYTSVGTGAKVIKNNEYAGNLLFYTTKDISFANTDNHPVQGSFITTGKISMVSNMVFAGQLIANSMEIGNEIDGKDFIYVPFDPPEIDIEGLVRDAKFVENDSLVEVPVHLTKTPETDVYIEFCYVEGAFGGLEAEKSADKNDLLSVDDDMPLCEVQVNGESKTVVGTSRRITIPAGSLVAIEDSQKPWIRVKDDGIVEGTQYIIFYVTKISGAVIKGNATAGGVYLTLLDKQNIPPKFDDSDPKLNVSENEVAANAGFISGIIRASDTDDDELLFEIVGGNGKDFFDIEKVDGKDEARISLKEGVSLDYEALSAQNFAYDITVKVYEFRAQGYDTKTFKVAVNDVNENPIVNDTTVHIREDVDASSSTPRILFSDIDVFNASFRENQMLPVGGDTAVFTVLPNGRLSIQPGVSLDFETKSEYTLKVKVVDKNDADLFDTATVTILVDDVDDSPHFVGDLDGSVLENSPKGTMVNTIHATCSDKTKTLSYYLEDPTGTFVIDPLTGVVTVNADDALNYELQSSYNVTVYVSDNGQKDAQMTSEKVVITVVDVNENPVFEGGTGDFSENLPVGTPIMTLIQGDLDIDARFRNNIFVLAGGDMEGFALDSLTGVITTTKIFDYEMDKVEYTLKVTVRDAEDADLAVTRDVVLTLTNENEAPNIITTKFTVEENAEGGTVVGILEGVDPDGDSPLSYILYDGDVPFSVKPDGQIVVKEGAVIDFETKNVYEFTVRVRDAGGLHSDSVITVQVEDVNEPPKVVDQRFVVAEDVEVSHTVGVIEASDLDTASKFSELGCEIVGESDVFDVQADCAIIVKAPLDYEADSLYKITVAVSDGELSDTAEVTVVVKDVFEKTEVVITRAENKDSVWLQPDTIYVHLTDLGLEWTVDNELQSCDTTLTEGTNIIIKEVCDEHKNECGRDTLVVFVSTAAPIVTVSAEKKDVVADNIYTIVEPVDEKDSSYYVNTRENDIMVTVSDSSTGYAKSFTVNVELETVQVPSSVYKTVSNIADAKVSLNEKAEVLRTPENEESIKVTYTDRVNGKDVLVTYYTDKDGEILKTPVVVDGRVKEIEAITVSYTEMLDGKNVTVSYKADASSGKRVQVLSGVGDGVSDVSVEGDFIVSFDYVDKSSNSVTISYTVDENGEIVSNGEDNTGYQVSYSYTNQYGNSATRSLFVVLDQVGPTVEILSPTKNAVIHENYVHVEWTVNGVAQDTLNVQGLDKGPGYIVRSYRDKAGNEATATVPVIMKNVKDIDIHVEKPVTIVDNDSVQKYYDVNPPKDGDRYVVSVLNPNTGREMETIVGGEKGERDGSGEEPYPGLDGHLGPSVGIDVRLPMVSDVGGLATLDDLIGKDGLVAIDGVDAANSEKMTVDDYIRENCSDEFAEHRYSDYSKMNLYDIDVDVDIWVYTTLGGFVDRFSFSQKMNDPELVNGAGHAEMHFEMKPDFDGNVRTADGRLLGTGAYLYKTEVKMTSKLRCTLPPVKDSQKVNSKKGAVVKSSDELLKPFGYKRPKK